MTTTPPGPQPTQADHIAIGELTDLAAELSQRGYTTHLITTPPPYLALGHPALTQPQHIHVQGEWFCWCNPAWPYGPALFGLRSIPRHITASHAHNVMTMTILSQRPTPPGA